MQLHYTLNELEELELKYKDNYEVLQLILWIKDRVKWHDIHEDMQEDQEGL